VCVVKTVRAEKGTGVVKMVRSQVQEMIEEREIDVSIIACRCSHSGLFCPQSDIAHAKMV
jgi:galactitol-specific phosphotransferase system IIB component